MKILRSLMRNNCGSLDLKPVHPDTVDQVLGNLSNSKSFGFDNIDTFCIKVARDELTPAITHIVNLSIMQNKFLELFYCSKKTILLIQRIIDRLPYSQY